MAEPTPKKRVTLPPPTAAAKAGVGTMVIVTNLGDIEVEFDRSKTPCTAAFLQFLSGGGFYDNTACHRLTTAQIHVLQCGDPTGTSRGGAGFQYGEEDVLRPTPAPTPTACSLFPSHFEIPEGLVPTGFPSGGTRIPFPTNFPSSIGCLPDWRGETAGSSVETTNDPRGTMAMAKEAAWNTTGSQFFFTYRDSVLVGQYTPFGKVTKGMDIIDQVAKGGVAGGGNDGKPKKPLRIISVQMS